MRFLLFSIGFAVLFSNPAAACGGSTHGGGHSGSSHHAPASDPSTGPYLARASHGGEIVAGEDVRYEVVVNDEEVRVYAYDLRETPLDLRDAGGDVRFTSIDDAGELAVPLVYVAGRRGHAGWLAAPLPGARSGRSIARIYMRDLPSEIEPELEIVPAWAVGKTTGPTATGGGHRH